MQAKNGIALYTDGINYNYWLQQLPKVGQSFFNSWLNQEQPIPVWSKEVRTVNLPKNENFFDFEYYYRLKTSLNTICMLFDNVVGYIKNVTVQWPESTTARHLILRFMISVNNHKTLYFNIWSLRFNSDTYQRRNANLEDSVDHKFG